MIRMATATIRPLYFLCVLSLTWGKSMPKRAFPPIGTGVSSNETGLFVGNTYLNPIYAHQYMRDITDDAKREYFEILKKTNNTIAEHKSEVMLWARKYLLEDKLSDFSKNDEEFKEELKENIYNLLKDLPYVYEEYNEIMENETQTYQERKQALDALRKEHRSEVALLKYATDLVSMKRRRYRKVDPRPGMEFYLQQKTKLMQRRLKGTQNKGHLRQHERHQEVSKSSIILPEIEDYVNNSLQDTV